MFDFLSDPFLLAFFIAGVVLLVAGRKLIWLLAAVVGFFVGLSLVQAWLPDLGIEARLGLSVLVGLAAAGLVVFVEKVGVGLVGLGVGGLITHWLISHLGYQVDGWLWLLVAVGAAVGWVLSRGAFKLGMAALSAVAGATLVLEAMGGGASYQPLILVGLAGVGVLIQMLPTRRRRVTK